MSTVITDDDAKRHIAANLSRILANRGMSQSDLAEATGETKMRISYIIRGVNVPSAACLGRIAEALDVSVDALLRRPENLSVSA